MTERPWVLLGASGHAKVVASVLRSRGASLVAALDDAPEKRGLPFCGLTISGPLSDLANHGDTWAAVGIGDNRARRSVVERLPAALWGTALHAAAWIDPTAILGVGAVVFAGAVVQVDSEIGRHAIVNTGASVDHDCRVGPFAHLAPGTHLAGGVTVGEGAFLGVGVSVIPGIRIGAWSTVGAGAVVVRDVPEGATVAGVPAKPLSPRTKETA